MALDLGELVGSLRLDTAPFDRALARGDAALNDFAAGAAADADAAGKKIGGNLADGTSSALDQLRETLPRTAKGAVSRASQEFRSLSPELRKAVDDAEAQARFDGLPVAARQGITAAEAEIRAGGAGAAAAAGRAGDDAGDTFSDEFRQATKDAGKVAGLAVGAGLAAGVVDSMSVDAGRRKLSAQLNLTEGDAKVAGELAGRVYTNNFGGSLDEVNDAVASVIRNTNLQLGDVNTQPAVEKVLALADTFEQDLGMTTAAAGQMVRTGMAKDIGEALDIITVGLQGPADKSGDLLETFNEYGTQFRKVGLGGADAVGLLTQALGAGARDADVAADAIKEFSIRTLEDLEQMDSKGRRSLTDLGAAYQSVLPDATTDQLYAAQQKIARGGEGARETLGQMLDGLRSIKDPAERSRTAVALFGTQAEDLGDALFAMDPTTAARELGEFGGAAQDVVDKTGGGPQATIEGYRRKLIGIGRDAIEATGPTAAVAGAVAAFGPAVAGVLPSIGALVAARAAQRTAAVVGAGAETAAAVATQRGWIQAAAASTVGAVKMAASWVIAMGPIGWVIAAVVGLVALIIANWDTVKRWTGAAWDWVVDKVKAVPGKIVGFFLNWTLPGLVIKHWDRLRDGVVEKGQAVISWVGGLPGRLWDRLSGLGGLMLNRGRSGFQQLRDGAGERVSAMLNWVGGIPGRVTDRAARLGGELLARGRSGFQQLRDGAGEKVSALLAWVGGIPSRVANNIGGVGRTLLGKGRDLIDGMREGVGDRWDALRSWLGGIPGRVAGSVPSLGGVLKGAGRAIMQGLISGIWDMWDRVQSTVRSITDWIGRNKGPKEVDLKLWRPAGNWIMEGLMRGLDDQMPALRRTVDGVTDTMASADFGGTAAPSSAALWANFYSTPPPSPAGPSAPRGGDTYNVYETTDARATAAEVSRRQAFAGVGG